MGVFSSCIYKRVCVLGHHSAHFEYLTILFVNYTSVKPTKWGKDIELPLHPRTYHHFLPVTTPYFQK